MTMNDVRNIARRDPLDYVERQTLCFSRPSPGLVVHDGQEGYREELVRLYSAAESNAAEMLVKLKDQLRRAPTDEFWELLVEGLATISGAQYAFVSKRMVVNHENLAVELPPLGEPGSCLMGAAFYFNDGHGTTKQMRNFKYHAYSCPCAHMRHDKIFIIPERLNDFIKDNPNELAIPGESYLGIPLFWDGKCFAHFGVMWSEEGASKKRLSWGYLEMLLHSLEDMILGRVLEGRNFADGLLHANPPARVVPHEAITASQSLKPYARSLSHELRTPMQGVVGMLDVMYATVQEAAEDQKDPRMRMVLESLKENIEVVQDSSRRAVEAADNVVHAYEMNMGVPETPAGNMDRAPEPLHRFDKRPDIVVTGNNISINLRNGKRRRESIQWNAGNSPKRQASETEWSFRGRQPFGQSASATRSLVQAMAHAQEDVSPKVNPRSSFVGNTYSPPFPSDRAIAPGLRHTNLQDVLRYIVNDSLKVGGRPESAIAEETDYGEIIEVRSQSPNGEEQVKTVEWSVDPHIPESILIDERDLSKIISCVMLNAIKFTSDGRICVTAKLSPQSRYIIINVKDTGVGIPSSFLPNLFKAFSREDDSLTRQSEGLGLGLLVAKGLARKLGGDLYCTSSETSGPHRGSVFEIRVPLTPEDPCSRPSSPYGSPSPARRSRSRHSTEVDPLDRGRAHLNHPTPLSTSEALKNALTDHRRAQRSTPTPTTPTIKEPEDVPMPTPQRTASPFTRRRTPFRRKSDTRTGPDRNLADKYPLNFLVAEDNHINRKLLVSMLRKLGYTNVREAYDGADAVRQMGAEMENGREVDVILMDLWMPYMDGYEATEKILTMKVSAQNGFSNKIPTILAVTADVTDGALERAAKVGMKGFMTKPYKLLDLEKLIVEYCSQHFAE